jgi:protoporphyrinogen oxidase
MTAVVGAGIGGSAVAHFLQQHFGPRVQIDVFEKGTVGGRLATISVNKQHYESGAASFHSLSLHMQGFVKQLGECTILGLAAALGPFPGDPDGQGQKVMCPISSFYRWSS